MSGQNSGDQQAPLAVIFDGSCGFCTACARYVENRAPARIVTFPSQQPGVLERYQIARREADESVWVIDQTSGKRMRGSEAMQRIFEEFGGGWAIIAALWSMPGADRIYAFAGRHRRLLGRLWSTKAPYS